MAKEVTNETQSLEELEELLTAEGEPQEDEFKAGMPISAEGLPTPMQVASVEGNDKVTIYETKTGEPSQALSYMLPKLLKIKNPDGTRRFTLRKPKTKPIEGTHKCLLHPDSPQRAHYTELGLPICRKANLHSPHGVVQHMQRRHPTAWGVLEQERKDAEREEDRQLHKALVESAMANKEPEKPPLYVSDKDKKKQETK